MQLRKAEKKKIIHITEDTLHYSSDIYSHSFRKNEHFLPLGPHNIFYLFQVEYLNLTHCEVVVYRYWSPTRVTSLRAEVRSYSLLCSGQSWC